MGMFTECTLKHLQENLFCVSSEWVLMEANRAPSNQPSWGFVFSGIDSPPPSHFSCWWRCLFSTLKLRQQKFGSTRKFNYLYLREMGRCDTCRKLPAREMKGITLMLKIATLWWSLYFVYFSVPRAPMTHRVFPET